MIWWDADCAPCFYSISIYKAASQKVSHLKAFCLMILRDSFRAMHHLHIITLAARRYRSRRQLRHNNTSHTRLLPQSISFSLSPARARAYFIEPTSARQRQPRFHWYSGGYWYFLLPLISVGGCCMIDRGRWYYDDEIIRRHIAVAPKKLASTSIPSLSLQMPLISQIIHQQSFSKNALTFTSRMAFSERIYLFALPSLLLR